MKCIVCDRCKKIIENPRNCRVITSAKPLKSPIDNCKTPYRGNDRQQNDIIWEKEICIGCLEELDAFFEGDATSVTPPEPVEPDNPDGEDENPTPPSEGDDESTEGES